MTSIEWLVKELFLEDTIYRYNLKVIEQAKEMHKQEIIDAVNSENRRCTNISNQSIKMLGFMESDLFRYDEKMGKDYYQETFVSKGSDEVPKCTCNIDSFLCQVHGTSDGKNIIAF
jgi:hypothetical protein